MIRHLLLDADGVLQSISGGGQAVLARPYLGDRSDELVAQLLVDERPALRGESDFRDDLPRWLERHGLKVDADRFYDLLWRSIDVAPTTADLVGRLRAAGYGVHLGSNQHRQRATYMRTELGYDDLLDVSCYSYELGAAKPEPAYFERALARIGARPGEVLFVDDLADNVAAAREVGLRAEQWELGQGLPVLIERLAAHGVELG